MSRPGSDEVPVQIHWVVTVAVLFLFATINTLSWLLG